MKLYNTLTRKTEEITPLSPPAVTIYTCGPTVYDYPHVGNWFTFIRYDLLVRTLKASGLKPRWVMNITDVGHLVSDADEGEDKLEKGARREGKTAWDVAKLYGDYFVDGLKRLNVSQPDYLPKATEHIEEQIDLIKQLEVRGFTYRIGDGIYYDTSKFPGYAAFAKLDLDDQQAGARVEVNPEKHNPTDFALWKFSPAGQKRDMEWDSPWGKGFPGWHLECSAMSMKYLGETLDIHAGGIDHLPVHHTNEIAQSEAVTGKRFANYWMHTNHISVNGEKIAKSLGNGITLEQMEEKGYDLTTFRLHVLESHYRSQSKFSWESLEAAKNRLQGYLEMAVLRWQAFDGDPGTPGDYIETSKKILAALQDDLNTPAALATLSAFSDEVKERGLSTTELEAFNSLLTFLDNTLGLNLLSGEDISPEQKQLVAERHATRQNKDWEKSDQLRDQLKEQGIGVRDTARGAIWYWL
jgi:cysteinyl-tRNA synthetase